MINRYSFSLPFRFTDAKVDISGVEIDSSNWIKKNDNEQLRIEGLG